LVGGVRHPSPIWRHFGARHVERLVQYGFPGAIAVHGPDADVARWLFAHQYDAAYLWLARATSGTALARAAVEISIPVLRA